MHSQAILRKYRIIIFLHNNDKGSEGEKLSSLMKNLLRIISVFGLKSNRNIHML